MGSPVMRSSEAGCLMSRAWQSFLPWEIFPGMTGNWSCSSCGKYDIAMFKSVFIVSPYSSSSSSSPSPSELAPSLSSLSSSFISRYCSRKEGCFCFSFMESMAARTIVSDKAGFVSLFVAVKIWRSAAQSGWGGGGGGAKIFFSPSNARVQTVTFSGVN